MKTGLKIALIVLLASGLFSIAFAIYYKRSDKLVYILTDKVFQEYAGTKETMAKLKSLKDAQAAKLDSLVLDIQAEEKLGKNPDRVAKGKAMYGKLSESYAAANQKQAQQYEEVLWKRINQGIADYGKEKGYKFVLGASGNGNIMYADTTLNVTADVVKYINKKYSDD